MGIFQNGFTGGLNQDLAKTKFPNTSYLEAYNMRLVTDQGTSTASLQNIRGNNLDFTIPNTFAVYKISVDLVGPYAAGTLTIAGQTSANTFTPSATSTGRDLYDFIDSDANLTAFSTSYNIAVASNYIIIYSKSINTSPSFAGTGLTVSTQVPAESNLIPIGFTTIRNEIYLYTTSNVSKNPGGHDPSLSVDSTSTGQIWKLTYNEVAHGTSLDLIYNGYLDFSTYRPIPTTATLGRYENTSTKRIYWTDFFNSLRALNVADPNAMALDPSLLSVAPAVDYSVPVLNKVKLGGSLEVGCYQLVYRLKNTGGTLTNYSEPSNNVFIVSADEGINTGGAGFKDYYGANQGTITSKAIEWNLKDLDTDFDRIEFVVIKRNSLGGTIFLYQFADEPMPADGSINITFTGNEDLTEILESDFLSLSSAFTHCKTIETKDNILFAGNVKNQYSDIDYDARAFRAKTSGADDIYLTNAGIQTLHTSAQAQSRPETDDTINDYTSVNAGYYKPNTAMLGGAGANISYEFGTIAVRCDSTIELATPSSSPFRHTNPEYSISEVDLDVLRIDNTNEQVYPLNSINDDIKYVYYSGLYKGYERNEIYRFGIQFYDRQKNPTFVKWIGDIKMPNFDDVNDNPLYEDGTAAPHADFRLSFTANKTGTTEAFVNQIFVKFTVEIPDSLTNKIDGYSIVRLDRPLEDKSIVATGFLNQVISDGGQLWLPDTQVDSGGCTGYPYLNINTSGGAACEALDTKVLFDAPEFLLGGYPGYKSGDIIKLACRNTIVNTTTSVLVDTGTEPYNIYKYYTTDAYYSDEFDIDEAGEVSFADTFQFTGWLFNNYTRTTPNTSDALGSKTLAIGLASAIDFSFTYGCTEGNGKKLIAQYVRPLTNQYGGNTYSNRSTNEYISCSHYRPIQEYVNSTGITTDTFKVFGGDVFTQVYDNQKAIKNWGQTARGTYSSGSVGTPGTNENKVSVTFFFPTSASHNTDLRHGIHVNKDLLTDDGSGASALETQTYNTVYSSNNDIKKYFPKPSEFNTEEEFDNRVHYSQIKINGELTDSWGVFKPNDFYDVEGSYGPINALEIFNENMIFLQEKAIGYLVINPVSQIVDTSGTSVVLGTGQTIQKHDYINTTIGTRHQNSVLKSPKGIYFIDIHTKRMYRISGEGFGSLSEVKGMSSWFQKHLKGNITTSDNPIYYGSSDGRIGISAGLDTRFNEVIYTLHDKYSYTDNGGRVDVSRSDTISFNEMTDTYTSFYNFTPYLYLYDNRFMSTFNPSRYGAVTPTLTQQCYIHEYGNYGQFYGTYYDSSIKLVANPNPSQHKIFDNLHLQTEVTTTLDETETDTGYGSTAVHETFNKLRIYNDYQDTGNTTLTVNDNITRRHRYWKTYIPTDTVNSTYSSFKPRIRDFYAIIQLGFTNNGNKRFICHDILTEFRLAGTPIST